MSIPRNAVFDARRFGNQVVITCDCAEPITLPLTDRMALQLEKTRNLSALAGRWYRIHEQGVKVLGGSNAVVTASGNRVIF